MAQNRRDEWHTRIKAVEREFIAARKAADDFLAALDKGTTTLPPDTKIRDANAMSDNLEGTYLIRLFAAFESGLRSYWVTLRDSKPPVTDLIDAIAARRAIPDDWRDDAHSVRKYRNQLVHESDSEVEEVGIAVARGALQRFFSRLPEEW